MITSHRPEKKLKALVLVTLGCLLAFDSSTGAQTTNQTTFPPAVATKGRRSAMSPLEMMRQSLNLSDEQAKNLEPMLKEQRDKLNALRRDTSLSRKDRIAKLKELQQGTDAKIKPLLTAEQAGKWQKLRHGQGPVFRQQGQSAGKTNAFSIGPQAASARQGLPTWSTHTQPPPQAQAQPANQQPAQK